LPPCPQVGKLREYGFSLENYMLSKIWLEKIWRPCSLMVTPTNAVCLHKVLMFSLWMEQPSKRKRYKIKDGPLEKTQFQGKRVSEIDRYFTEIRFCYRHYTLNWGSWNILFRTMKNMVRVLSFWEKISEIQWCQIKRGHFSWTTGSWNS
jgi:hypothetical protein